MQVQPQELLTGLAAESLRRAGRLRVRVTGSSMLPAICPGDVVFVRPCEFEAVRPGDIIAFLQSGRLYVHRTVARGESTLLTRGDCNRDDDAGVLRGDFLGKVARVAARGRARRPLPHPARMQRIAAAVFRGSPVAGRIFTRIRALLHPRRAPPRPPAGLSSTIVRPGRIRPASQ